MTPDCARPPAAEGPWLVADIGGTNARFGWVAGAAPDAPVRDAATLRCADHAGPAEAAAAYLDGLRAAAGAQWRPPRAAAFAVATALAGDAVALTNSGWSFSRQAVCRALQLDELRLLNDFEALALALPRLRPQQLRAVGAALPVPQPGDGALAVLGPGTGLGVAALLPTPAGWVPVPGEGGHATLAAADDDEAALLAAARQELALGHGAGAVPGPAEAAPHLSAERLLSGIGLPLLHRAVARLARQPAPAPLDAAAIVQRGLDGSDALCAATLERFCALLGGFAGNVALTVGARGGVYIGGGIVPRLGERFAQSAFRARFEAKGRFRDYLRAIPTAVITDTDAALAGAAAALAASVPQR